MAETRRARGERPGLLKREPGRRRDARWAVRASQGFFGEAREAIGASRRVHGASRHSIGARGGIEGGSWNFQRAAREAIGEARFPEEGGSKNDWGGARREWRGFRRERVGQWKRASGATGDERGRIGGESLERLRERRAEFGGPLAAPTRVGSMNRERRATRWVEHR